MCLADLIEMAGKKKVVPIEIEEYIKSKVEFLSNVVLIGHQRKHLTCLLTLKVKTYLTSKKARVSSVVSVLSVSWIVILEKPQMNFNHM